MDILKCIICENYLWFISTFILLFLSFIWVLIVVNKKKRRFLIWKKETVNFGIYSSEKEYGENELLQELYDENLSLKKENKILKKKVSDSSLWGIIVLCVVIIAMWVKRSKNNKNEPDDTPLNTPTGNDDEITLLEE